MDDVDALVESLVSEWRPFVWFDDVDGEEVILSTSELTLVTIPIFSPDDDEENSGDDVA